MKKLGFLVVATFSCVATAQIYRCSSNEGGSEYVNNANDAQRRGCLLLKGKEASVTDPVVDLSSVTVSAEWRLVGKTDTQSVFIRRGPMMREGNFLKSWTLWVFQGQRLLRDGVAYNSLKSLDLYDCKNNTFAIRQSVYYLNVAGEGNPVRSITYNAQESTFEDYVPGTIGEKVFETVCKK